MAWFRKKTDPRALVAWHESVTMPFIARTMGGTGISPEWKIFWELPCISAALMVLEAVTDADSSREGKRQPLKRFSHKRGYADIPHENGVQACFTLMSYFATWLLYGASPGEEGKEYKLDPLVSSTALDQFTGMVDGDPYASSLFAVHLVHVMRITGSWYGNGRMIDLMFRPLAGNNPAIEDLARRVCDEGESLNTALSELRLGEEAKDGVLGLRPGPYSSRAEHLMLVTRMSEHNRMAAEMCDGSLSLLFANLVAGTMLERGALKDAEGPSFVEVTVRRLDALK